MSLKTQYMMVIQSGKTKFDTVTSLQMMITQSYDCDETEKYYMLPTKLPMKCFRVSNSWIKPSENNSLFEMLCHLCEVRNQAYLYPGGMTETRKSCRDIFYIFYMFGAYVVSFVFLIKVTTVRGNCLTFRCWMNACFFTVQWIIVNLLHSPPFRPHPLLPAPLTQPVSICFLL